MTVKEVNIEVSCVLDLVNCELRTFTNQQEMTVPVIIILLHLALHNNVTPHAVTALNQM